ncbi:type IV secretory system conjugative DNA transfer family protein [Parvularcula flava]|uniref:Type IV secretory system conjugative DNA transfer family protein n=1 Tax=Aquisalinus luteolus TaxID=1566827 RepID=A0A8J3ES57_9PROT|nr:type IV secretory system conjugative DNA transfer family protein [Aquisalinus luteolus]NHK29404.1 type IV secretory system conjugative DNA transfer family protein [Aquisalinus luteolus]GGI02052.1 hypothetical protein GCM10011355_34150 [Aquisalinus luteolus]
MSKKADKTKISVPAQILGLPPLYWLTKETAPLIHSEDWFLVPLFVWFMTAALTLEFTGTLCKFTPRILRQRNAKRPQGHKGTASWATLSEVRRASNRKRGFFAGAIGNFAAFFEIETSGMVLAPAGGAKTIGFVIPALLNNPMSMLVTDLKGSLACVTARHRRKKLGHRTYFLNPGGLFTNTLGPTTRFNPLHVLIKDWANPERHKFLMTDVRGLAKQLLPEPPNAGENTFFRDGSRALLEFTMAYLVTSYGKVTLSEMLSLLRDVERLEGALHTGRFSDALSGDLASSAADILGKLGDGDRRQFESFREGALQVLRPFSPSGVLAAATEESDFDFAEMKTGKVTVYLICDPTQQEVFESWIGLVSKGAITELIRSESRNPVLLLLDEATNFKIESLPKLLTSVREFGIRVFVVLQELEQWAHVYGRESLETLLSQTELKIIHGSRSQKTCELVSKMLGNRSVRAESFNTGKHIFDQVTRSVSEIGVPLKTPEQISQMKEAIVFYKNLPPILVDKVGYHEISPWRRWADANPYFGQKRFRGKVRLRL